MIAGKNGFKFFYSLLIGVLVWILGGAILFGLGLGTEKNDPLWHLLIFSLVLSAAELLTCFVWSYRKKWSLELGLAAKPIDLLGIPIGAAIQFPILLILYLPFYPIVNRSEISRAAEEIFEKADGVSGKIILVILTIVLAPIVEEIFFRGFLQRAAIQFIKNRHVAIILVAVLFSAVHYSLDISWNAQWHLWGVFVIGVVLGYIVNRTGRLGMAIATHIGFNLVAFILQL